MWIKTIFFALMVISGNCAMKYSHSKQSLPNKNQRIIKVHAAPQFNHFHSHPHKHVVTRPLMLVHQKEATKDFIRPSHSPSSPPFFNGPSTNHVKHLPRPPPHVVHKTPSYGIGFPYKNVNSLRAAAFKAPFRVQASGLVRPPSVKQTAQVTQVAKPSKLIPSPSVLPASQIPAKGATASSSLYSPTFAYTNFFSSAPIRHIISSDDNNGPIREIPAPNLGPKPSGGGGGLSGLGFIKPTAFANTLEEPVVKIGPVVKKPVLDDSVHIKDLSGNQFSEGGGPSFDIKDLEQADPNDVNKLFQNIAISGTYNHGYEVKEQQHHAPTNDQVLKGLGGEKFYYAPDPDPSLPVYKVPPTNDPQSTPSNGQKVKSLYFPQAPYGFSYIPAAPAGGAVATLTAQELYQLMQGYPTVLSQPQPQAVVSFIGQPQPNSVILQGNANQNYYNEQNSKEASQENDVAQYLQNPDIHNLIHNTPESAPQQSTLTSVTNPTENLEAYSHQSIYQDFSQPHAQAQGLENSEADYLGPDSNYDFEPEASESKNSFTVIRQSSEGTEGSTKVKKLLLEESNLKSSNFQIESEELTSSETTPEVFEFKNAPEVPLYTSLPNQQAAEALAGLQAAGSVASNYMNRIKQKRNNEEGDEQDTRGKVTDRIDIDGINTVINLSTSIQRGTTPSAIAESVDDEAILEDNTEFTSEGQVEGDLADVDFKDDDIGNETFGKRLKPKSKLHK